MPDDNTQVATSTSQTSPYEGVSRPPDGGQVTSVDPPANQMQPNGGSGSAMPDGSPAGPSPAPTPSPDQGPGQGLTSASMQGRPATPGSQLSQGGAKAGQPPTSGAAADAAVHPAVARASVFHDVAQALAGGSQYKYAVDPQTGTMRRVPVPLNKGQIGMAIALEAISGSLAGLSQRGPGANARGAEAAFQQAQQKTQDQKQQAQKMASDDYARQTQIFENNMRMRSMALQVGKQGLQAHNDWISQFTPMADEIIKNHPEWLDPNNYIVHHSDFGKFNVTEHNAVPYKAVPLLKDGVQVNSADGTPLWDDLYIVFKPGQRPGDKATGLVSQQTIDTHRQMGTPGGDNPNLESSALNVLVSGSLTGKAAQFTLAKSALEDGQTVLNGATGNSTDANKLIDLKIPDPKVAQAIAPAVENAASRYKVDPVMLAKIGKGIIMQESGGRSDVVDNTSSTKGPAQGVMQIIPATQKLLGITDPHDVTQSVNGGINYLAQLLSKNPDPMKAIASYNGSGPDADAYAQQVAARIGLTPGGATPPADALEAPNWDSLVKATPTLPNDMAKFQSAYSAANNSMQGAFNHMIANGQAESANNIISALYKGDATAPQTIDQQKALNTALKQETQRANVSEHEAAAKAETKNAIALQSANAMDDMIRGPQNWDRDAHPELEGLGSKALSDKLTSLGVKVPANFTDLYKIAFYDDSPDNFTPKVWRTGDPNVMSKTQAMNYIGNFINPNFDQKQYANMSATERRLANPDSQFNRTILSVGTTVNHMDLLRKAAHEVATQNPAGGQFPALNALAGNYGVAVGEAPYLTLQALTRRVNGEISNVAGGGFAPHAADIDETQRNMTPANAEAQIDSLLDTYTQLMHGRLEPQEAWLKAQTGQDLKGVSPEASALFRKMGLDTPWDKTAQTQPQQFKKYTTDGKWGFNGTTWVALGPQATQPQGQGQPGQTVHNKPSNPIQARPAFLTAQPLQPTQ